MDQTKNQGDAQRQNNPGQGNQGQGNRTQGNNPGQGGQQNWNQGQNPNRDKAEGSRDKVRGGEEGGPGNQGEQSRDQNSGVTNRGSDREMSEQQDLPERGRSRSDSQSGSNR